MRSDPALALSLALLVALSYLVVLRLIDPYEKEPVWALSMMLFFGAASAGAAAAILPVGSREDTALGIALTAEISKAMAIAIGMAAFAVIKRLKGWSEVNGVIDGVVYGAAAGLGFATGSAFVSEIAFSASAGQLPGQPGFLDVLLTTALSGLSDGIFGGMIGAGIVAATQARSTVKAVLLGATGLLLAVATHLAYIELAHQGSPFDSGDHGGHWLPLAVSIVVLVVVVIRSAAEERRLASEMTELNWLAETSGRRRAYFRTFVQGDVENWLRLRTLHSRQIQLAVAQRRLRETPPWAAARRQAIEDEVTNLRASLATVRRQVANAAVVPRSSTREARVTVLAISAATLAAGLGAIALGAVSERDARANAAKQRAREPTPSGRAIAVRTTAAPGRLREQLMHRVGPYLLLGGRNDRDAPSAAVEAFVLRYATPSHRTARHRVARFSSVDAAERSRGRVVRRLKGAGWRVNSRVSFGSVAFLKRGRRMTVVWSGGRLQAAVTADRAAAVKFYLKIPY